MAGKLLVPAGRILPDLFALYVLYLTSRFSGARASLYEGAYEAVNIADDEVRISVSNHVAEMVLKRQFLSFTFFVPGFVSMTSYLSIMAERGFAQWMPFVVFAMVLLFAADVYYYVNGHRDGLDQAMRFHRWITVLLILLCIAGKSFA